MAVYIAVSMTLFNIFSRVHIAGSVVVRVPIDINLNAYPVMSRLVLSQITILDWTLHGGSRFWSHLMFDLRHGCKRYSVIKRLVLPNSHFNLEVSNVTQEYETHDVEDVLGLSFHQGKWHNQALVCVDVSIFDEEFKKALGVPDADGGLLKVLQHCSIISKDYIDAGQAKATVEAVRFWIDWGALRTFRRQTYRQSLFVLFMFERTSS